VYKEWQIYQKSSRKKTCDIQIHSEAIKMFSCLFGMKVDRASGIFKTE
jgi:hypothetical protein